MSCYLLWNQWIISNHGSYILQELRNLLIRISKLFPSVCLTTYLNSQLHPLSSCSPFILMVRRVGDKKLLPASCSFTALEVKIFSWPFLFPSFLQLMYTQPSGRKASIALLSGGQVRSVSNIHNIACYTSYTFPQPKNGLIVPCFSLFVLSSVCLFLFPSL